MCKLAKLWLFAGGFACACPAQDCTGSPALVEVPER